MKEGSLGTVGIVKVGEKKYQEKDGESDQNAYVYCAIYVIYITYIYIYIYI